ncbi:MAG TPA: hypothetical protein VFO77_00880 [Actinoplanes sp.]|nr:hypothetical protein [Actinoplanes sp.]
MRADVLVGPSPWLVEQFGAGVAAELWTRIPEALSTAISREVNAHHSNLHGAERMLGNPRWALPYEELALLLGGLEGAHTVGTTKSVYRLVVLRGHVLLPWCYGQSGGIAMQDAEIGRSFGRLARELLRRFGPPWQRSRTELPLPLDVVDEREVAKVCGGIAQLEPAPRIMICGYAGTAHHGLLRSCLGQVGATDGGAIGWSHVTDLPLPPPVIPRPRRLRFP